MIAEVISIGDELTDGARLDTNSQWLSRRLGELGIRVLFHTTVGDDLAADAGAFRAAVDRADVVIVTGGLGPTADDLTREALARATGTELVFDAAALAEIEKMFSRRGRPMPDSNRSQAMFPAGADAIRNPRGTAPGVHVSVARDGGRAESHVFALPGVPVEMQRMWRATVAPRLAALSPGRAIRHFRVKCFGTGESHLEQMLPDLIRRGREPSVGITVHEATITLRITSRADTPEAATAAMEPTIRDIRESLGTLVFGTEDDELEHAVARLLIETGKTLATAEWGTGGRIADWLSGVDGPLGCYRGGVVVRSPAAVRDVLGTPDGEAPDDGAELARFMAQAVCRTAGSDVALAVGPLPEWQETAAAGAGFHVAVCEAGRTIDRSFPLSVARDIHIPYTAKHALNVLRLYLLEASTPPPG